MTFPWPWEILFLPDISLTAMNPGSDRMHTLSADIESMWAKTCWHAVSQEVLPAWRDIDTIKQLFIHLIVMLRDISTRHFGIISTEVMRRARSITLVSWDAKSSCALPGKESSIKTWNMKIKMSSGLSSLATVKKNNWQPAMLSMMIRLST